jgi:TolB-like protein
LSFVEELKRRNVFKVAAAYLVLGWLIIQVVDLLAPRMGLPEWVPGFFIMLVLVGFPVAVFLTWAFEMTPEGVRRSEGVDRAGAAPSSGGHGVQYVVIAALALVVLVQQLAPRLSELNPFGTDTSSDPVSIAVLPFSDLSSAGDQEYLGDGVAEEILNVLASIDGLSVTSRTSSFAFKAQNRQIPEIAEVLGVTHVVEGSIRKQDNRVRITAQLIEVTEDSHLWSDTYDATLDDIFQLEDQIAGEISSALSDRLNLALPGVDRETPDWDPVAHELFLRARSLVVTRTQSDEAIQLARSALVIEPDFADAHALIATSLALGAFALGRQQETWEASWAMYDEAWLQVANAVMIDPAHPLGLAVQGLIRMNQKRWIEARAYFERALSVPVPDVNAFLWLAILQFQTGDWGGAFQTLDDGLRLYPNDPNLLRWLGESQGALGNWDDAWEQLEFPATLGISDASAHRQLAGLLTGRIPLEEFLRWASATMDEDGVPPESRDMGLAAVRSIVEMEPAPVGAGVEDLSWFQNQSIGWTQFWPARLFAAERPQPFEEFLRAGIPDRLDQPNTFVFQEFWIPGRSLLRRDPVFRKAVFDLGFVEYWQLYGWPEVCGPVGVRDFECN